MFETYRKCGRIRINILKSLKNMKEETPMENKWKDTVSSIVEKMNLKKWKNKFVLLLVVACLSFFMGVYVCVAKPWQNDSQAEQKVGTKPIINIVDTEIVEENYILTISNVEEVLKPASDLISTKYYYTDADTYENYKELFGQKVPFTTDKVVFTYDGVISVGIDLSAVEYEIDNDNQVITITLPELRILSNEIDESSFEFPYTSDSIFNSTQMGDYMELIGELKQEKENELWENAEFMSYALENTKVVLENFLTKSEMTRAYEIIFK